MKRQESSDLVNKNLWKLAEQEALFLIRSYHLTPQDVVRQYTGKTSPEMEITHAVDAVYSFNVNQANKNGFLPY